MPIQSEAAGMRGVGQAAGTSGVGKLTSGSRIHTSWPFILACFVYACGGRSRQVYWEHWERGGARSGETA